MTQAPRTFQPEETTGIAGLSPPYLIHLGCNRTRIPGWLNIDARATDATNLVHDCRDLSIFDDKSTNMVFSNAFFEHLTMHDRAALLRDIHRVLTDDGFLYFCGVPDFETIARSYLERRPGNVSSRFDLFEAYRYTHGDPEHQSEWWMEQLHKTLFDVETLKTLLNEAGFRTHYVYRYAYGKEANAVNLGFMAWKDVRAFSDKDALPIISLFAPLTQPNMERLELGL